jgi:hypothetical protein
MKRRILALALILVLLLMTVALYFPSFALANPMYEIPYPSEPNKELPTLKVESPQNGTAYTAGKAELAFTVTKPDSWDTYWNAGVSELIPVIGSYIVWIYLDGNETHHFLDPHLQSVPITNYSLTLDWLISGTHTLKIDLKAKTYYKNPHPDPYDYLEHIMNVSETIHFNITPASTPSPGSQQERFPTTLVATASGASATIVGLGVLLYFKKRKR